MYILSDGLVNRTVAENVFAWRFVVAVLLTVLTGGFLYPPSLLEIGVVFNNHLYTNEMPLKPYMHYTTIILFVYFEMCNAWSSHQSNVSCLFTRTWHVFPVCFKRA